MRTCLKAWLALMLSLLTSIGFAGFEDPNFTEQQIPRPDGNGWQELVGLQFSPDGQRAFLWERGGRIWIWDEAEPVSSPLLDISDEVLGWRDHGLLGFSLDPNFISNGYLYLSYGVDRHHLEHCSEPDSGVGRPVCDAGYNPNTTVTVTQASIMRITRYQANRPSGDSDYRNATSVNYDSRKVLVGETRQTGAPNLHQSHSNGQLVFGTDGTLLAAFGDGASYSGTDVGSRSDTAYQQALQDGILVPETNVGSFRAQMLESLSGKIIRIDPSTGDAIPSNPFYDSSAPRSAKSRVWALGLRNPYRMVLQPGTGSHEPSDGAPGTLFIGDVGWSTWEELNVADGPARNFGWPAYEGMERQDSYFNNAPVHQYASSALGCQVTFTNLIKQESISTPDFPSPCGGQIIGYPTFELHRPRLDWHHRGLDLARYPAFDNNDNPVSVSVGQPIPGTGTVITEGDRFNGNASTAGVWYTGEDFPERYKNTYFHADYAGNWIKNFVVRDDYRVAEVKDFINDVGGVVFVTTNPVEGGLYYARFPDGLLKVTYAPGGNRPPTAVAEADVHFGPSPLDVNFSSAQSFDPEGQSLSSQWQFGDGSTGTGTYPSHTYTAPNSDPASFNVTLTVSDNDTPSLNDSDSLLISVNNSPPQVAITSPVDGSKYPVSQDTLYALEADIADDEHPSDQLRCAWKTVLHHNDHTHQDPVDNQCQTQVQIPPLGCDGEIYYFTIQLDVTDPEGLTGSDVITLYPDCEGAVPPQAKNDQASVAVGNSIEINLVANDSAPEGFNLDSLIIVSGPVRGTVNVIEGTGRVSYTPSGNTTGSDSFSYRLEDRLGISTNTAQVALTVTSGTGTPQVATPSITPPGGAFADPVNVTLATETPQAVIRYTLDGSLPNESSAQYAEPLLLPVGPSRQLQARAFRDGWLASTTASAQFDFDQSGLPPAVSITSPQEGQEISGNIQVSWQLSGDDSAFNHVHLRLDDEEHVALHDLTRSNFDLGEISAGSHQVRVWLVNENHEALENPEASDTVAFTVVARPPASISMLSPRQGESLTGDVEARWSISGTFDRLMLKLDDSAPLVFREQTRHNFGSLAPGSHLLTAWLVNADDDELPNTRMSVDFTVTAESSNNDGGGGGGSSAPWLLLLLLAEFYRRRGRKAPVMPALTPTHNVGLPQSLRTRL